MSSIAPIRLHIPSHLLSQAVAVVVASALVLVGACREQAKAPAPIKTLMFAGKDDRSAAEFTSELMATSLLASGGSAKARSSPIAVGETLEGALGSEDTQTFAGRYFDAWFFELDRASVMEIVMRSSEIDARVALFRGTVAEYGESLGTDDDGGGGTDARIVTNLDPGEYTVLATSYSSGEMGAYDLRVGQDREAMVLGVGGFVEGELDSSDPVLSSGERFEEWTYSGRAGESLIITMSSEDIDPYLSVADPESGRSIGYDDDGGEGYDARVAITLPYTGRYSIIATSFSPDEVGVYTLAVEGNRTALEFETGGPADARYALLVGIDDYPGSRSDLRGPVNDVALMADVLTERFGFADEDILTLTDEQATRANIANGIARHLGQAGPNGMAVFFFSGHGTQIGSNIGIGPPIDPEPRGRGDEALVVHGYNRESSILLDEELGFLIESVDAGRSLVVVDACYSGQITRGPGDGPQPKAIPLGDSEFSETLLLPKNFVAFEVIDESGNNLPIGFGDLDAIAASMQAPQTHVMWSSSTEDQVSWTSGSVSVFTKYLTERLRGESAARTLNEVAGAVSDDVEEYILSTDGMTMQSPVISGRDGALTLREFFGLERGQ